MKERKILTSREYWAKQARQSTSQHIINPEWANEELQTVKKMFDEAGITFFLFFGTMLGAVREKDFILYDEDVDIGILGKDMFKVCDLENKFKEIGYSFNRCSVLKKINNKMVFSQFFVVRKEKGVKLDIYIFYLWDHKRWWYNWGGDKIKWFGLGYPEKYFQSFETIDFKGTIYNIPNHVEELLEFMWGSWWIATGAGQGGYQPISTFIQGEPITEDL